MRSPSVVRHATLFLSVVMLVAGSGMLGTLLGIRAAIEGIPRLGIGLLMSSYFGGYLIGSLAIPRLIYKVGHIRSFAGLTSIASTVSLAHALTASTLSWTFLRAVHGLCYAGLMLVIESWLNGNTGTRERGRVLAAYGAIALLALALGQLILNAAPPSTFVPFCIVSILLSLALVPVTMTDVGVPGVVEAERMSLRRIWVVSPVGVTGVFVVGVTFSAFMGLGPSFAVDAGLGTTGVSVFMSSAMMGALILQWPLGILSDRIDRRWVILGCASGVVAVSALLSSGAEPFPAALVGLIGLFGSLSVPVYSVCVANAIDWVPQREVIPATSSLLIIFGAGSILGPIAGGLAMSATGPRGLFLVTGAANLLLFLYGLNRLMRRSRPPEQTREAFAALPRTTHVVLQLDDRGIAAPVAEDGE